MSSPRVAAALFNLGNAFLAHPESSDLRAALTDGRLEAAAYVRQLVGLALRLIFLRMAAERCLLPPAAAAVRRLEAASAFPASPITHPDLWAALTAAFRTLRGAGGAAGLFAPDICPDLERAACAGEALAAAIHLGPGSPHSPYPLPAETLGTVYEQLLDLTPGPFPPREGVPWSGVLDDPRRVGFQGASEEGTPSFRGKGPGVRSGAGRKRTGAFYTPATLVEALLAEALAPVLRARLAAVAAAARESTLLALTVCDPAAGGGHFLLAAARRLAEDLARLRCGADPPADARRAALREVARNCLYGVDRDPLAVAVTRAALWLEVAEPSLPLSFLDRRLVCGDSLASASGFHPALSRGAAVFDWREAFPTVAAAGGFDVVLGNPPFGGEAVTGGRRASVGGNANPAALFAQRSLTLVRAGGRLGLVLPKSLTFSSRWSGVRRLLAPHLTAVFDAGRAWGEVRLEQVAIVAACPAPAAEIRVGGLVGAAPPRPVPRAFVQEHDLIPCDADPVAWGLVARLAASPLRLGGLCRTTRGLALQRRVVPAGPVPVLAGRDLARYRLGPPGAFLNEEAACALSPGLPASKVVYQNIVAHVGRPRPHLKIIACLDAAGHLTLDTVNNLVPRTGRLELPAVVGLLNSKVVNWLAWRLLYNQAIRTMHLDQHFLDRLPVPDGFLDSQAELARLAEQIASGLSGGAPAQVAGALTALDIRIADLYGLTPSEREMVWSEFPPVDV
jgi:hypothetical protein